MQHCTRRVFHICLESNRQMNDLIVLVPIASFDHTEHSMISPYLRGEVGWAQFPLSSLSIKKEMAP